jgi:homoserine kinase type II
VAVYTNPTADELADFLQAYALGEVTNLTGIRDGIENSNFYLTTSTAGTLVEHVLTLFETMPAAALDWYLALMAFLAAQGIPCAAPRLNRNGGALGELRGKPAAIFHRLAGQSLSQPNAEACAAVGRLLARMHVAGARFERHQPDPRGAPWREETAGCLLPTLDESNATLLREELALQRAAPLGALPQGVIHADLFRDNVLFEGDRLSGAIDFYYACHGALLYDLAITVIDWCLMDRPKLEVATARALVLAYQQVRPLTTAERLAWPSAWRAAGLRFWLSRLKDAQEPRAGVLTWQKDPEEFRQVILLARGAPAQLLALLAEH